MRDIAWGYLALWVLWIGLIGLSVALTAGAAAAGRKQYRVSFSRSWRFGVDRYPLFKFDPCLEDWRGGHGSVDIVAAVTVVCVGPLRFSWEGPDA